MSSVFKIRTMLEEAGKTYKKFDLIELLFLMTVAGGSARGITQIDVQSALKLEPAKTSRTVSLLGMELGLIQQDIDPENRSRRILRLSAKGERFVRDLVKAVE